MPAPFSRGLRIFQMIGRPFPPVLAPLLLAFGSYVTSLKNEFVYDDVHIIVDNDVLHSLGNIREIITGSWWPDALYRPVTQLTFALDWVIGDGNPAYFHFGNVVLHILCTLLVYRLARRMLPVVGCVVAASLFAVHPVHVEAVANVVGRAEVLATLLVLGTALLYLIDGDLAASGNARGRRLAATGGVLGLSLLAYGSKESALALPGILLMLDWLTARQKNLRFDDVVLRHWMLLVGTLVLALEWMVIRWIVLGDLAGDHPGPGVFGEDFFGRLRAMAPVVLEWIRLLIFPLHLSADYSPDYLPQGWGWRAVTGVTSVIALVVIAVRSSAKQPLVTFGLAWLGGTLLIVSNLIVPSGVLLAERSLYLPSVGFCWLAAFLLMKIENRKAVVFGGIAVVVGLGLARTVERVSVWQSATTFFPRLVVDARGSFRSYWVAGHIAYQRGDRQAGETLMRRAIDIYPVFPNLWSDLAIEFEREERWSEAGDFFAAAYRIDTDRLQDAVNAIENYVRGGELDQAESLAHSARWAGSSDFRLLILLADVALARGLPLRAMTYRRQVAFRFPGVWQYWYLTAEAASLAGYCPEAERSLRRVREIIPEFEDELGVVRTYDSLGCK